MGTGGEATPRNIRRTVDLLAPRESTRALALDAAREAFRGDLGVPLIAAIGQVVDATDVDQLFESELVTQCAGGGEPVGRLDIHRRFAAWLDHGDQRAR